MKPSDVKDIIPVMSLGDFNAEKVAMWTARILAETGNEWRPLKWEEVAALLPPNEDSNNRLFKVYFRQIDTEDKAKTLWRFAFKSNS